MSYLLTNSVTSINGVSGPYSDKVKNKSVAYGRNAVANFSPNLDKFNQALPAVERLTRKDMLEHDANGFKVQDNTYKNAVDSFDKSIDNGVNQVKNTPLNFELRYMNAPAGDGNFDKMALMGAAFEEMGKKISMPVQDLTKKLQAAFGDKASANAFDVNKDGQVDIGEYSASIVLEDMMSKDPNKLDYKNVTGLVTNKGQDALMQYITPKNPQYAAEEVALLHKSQELDKAKNLFAADPNNMVE